MGRLSNVGKRVANGQDGDLAMIRAGLAWW
jgi:hypothetical protein